MRSSNGAARTRRSRGGVIRNVARSIHRDLPKGGHLEDIASLHELGLRCCHADDLPRREAPGGRLGRTVQLQAQAAAGSLYGWRIA